MRGSCGQKGNALSHYFKGGADASNEYTGTMAGMEKETLLRGLEEGDWKETESGVGCWVNEGTLGAPLKTRAGRVHAW